MVGSSSFADDDLGFGPYDRIGVLTRWLEIVIMATTRDAGKTIKMFCRSLGLLNSFFFH
jgi:hypothetical protein